MDEHGRNCVFSVFLCQAVSPKDHVRLTGSFGIRSLKTCAKEALERLLPTVARWEWSARWEASATLRTRSRTS